MFLGIEHTAIASHDPERLAQWYVEHLGFSIHYHSPSSKTTFVKAPNGALLEMIAAQGERGSQAMREPGLRHLAIAVSDFDAAYAHLQQAGANFVTAPENAKGNRIVFFTDPDGNLLHLIQRAQPL